MLKKTSVFVTGIMVLLAIVALATTAQAAITISNQSGSVVYTDFGNGQNAVYLVFQISSSDPAGDGVDTEAWVKLVTGAGSIQNVGSGIHQLKFKPGPGTAEPTGEFGLVAGLPKGAFFLVSASTLTNTPQNLTIEVYNGDPNGAGTLIDSAVFGFTVEDTIQANANKVNTVVTIPDNPEIGNLGKITVTGCTGVVGAQNVLYFSPVTADTWPADGFEFIDSVIEIAGYPNTPYKNVAKIPSADVAANSSDHCYTMTFTFVINAIGSASTTPSNYIASGQKIKHTTTDSGSFDVIVPPEECPEITVTHNPDPLPPGTIGSVYGPVQFSASADDTGYGNYEFTSSSPPPGLTLSLAGVLTGTPTTGGTFSFTVTATDKLKDEPIGCTGQVTVSVTIDCPTITVNPGSLSAGTINTSYGPVQFTASDGSGSYSFEWDGNLPAGMDLTGDGELSGTPTETGTFNFTVSAIDDNTGCVGSRSLSLTIRSLHTAIPTLSEWGMIIMSLLLAGSAVWMIRRRQMV
jgi:hypothetical protein